MWKTVSSALRVQLIVGVPIFFRGFPGVVTRVGDETCNVVVTVDGPASATEFHPGVDPRVSVHGTHVWVQGVREDEIDLADER